MSVDQQDRYIAVGDAFHQFEARNIRQSRLDYREIEATGRQGLSRGPAATGANNGCSAELFKSRREGLTDTVICIYDEKFQHFDRSSPRYRCYYDTSLPPVVQVICEAETALACAPYLIRKANITLSARADQGAPTERRHQACFRAVAAYPSAGGRAVRGTDDCQPIGMLVRCLIDRCRTLPHQRQGGPNVALPAAAFIRDDGSRDFAVCRRPQRCAIGVRRLGAGRRYRRKRRPQP